MVAHHEASLHTPNLDQHPLYGRHATVKVMSRDLIKVCMNGVKQLTQKNT